MAGRATTRRPRPTGLNAGVFQGHQLLCRESAPLKILGESGPSSFIQTEQKEGNIARKVIREAEEFHAQLNFELIVGFEGRGHASHGGAIAVKRGVVVTDVQYGFNGGREEKGRVLMSRVATEEKDFNGEQVDGMWIVQNN